MSLLLVSARSAPFDFSPIAAQWFGPRSLIVIVCFSNIYLKSVSALPDNSFGWRPRMP